MMTPHVKKMTWNYLSNLGEGEECVEKSREKVVIHNDINTRRRVCLSLSLMATSSSPTTCVRSLFRNPPRALLSFPHSFHAVKRSFSSSASYATLKLPLGFSLSPTPLISKGLSHRRTPLVRAATIEEIEAEKEAIENDAVSFWTISSFFCHPSLL